MRLSKILKKDSVVIKEGKYTIPINNINNKNKKYFNEIINEGESDKFDKSEKSKNSKNRKNFSNLSNTEDSGSFAKSASEYFESNGADSQNMTRELNEPDYHLNHPNYQDYQDYQEYQEHEKERERANELIREEIIAQAQKTAEIIINHTLESAKSELDGVISQGYKEGFDEGKGEALKIIEPSLLKIKILVDSIKKMQDKMLEEFKDGMFNIISDISGKILHKEIEEKDEYLFELFADAVKSIKTENFVTVTVSGAQIDFAMRNIDLFRSQVENINDFKILADKGAKKGTMVVETSKVLADASYNVQQEKIDYIISQMRDNLSVPETAGESETLQSYFSNNLNNISNISVINNINNTDAEGIVDNNKNYDNNIYDNYSYDGNGDYYDADVSGMNLNYEYEDNQTDQNEQNEQINKYDEYNENGVEVVGEK